MRPRFQHWFSCIAFAFLAAQQAYHAPCAASEDPDFDQSQSDGRFLVSECGRAFAKTSRINKTVEIYDSTSPFRLWKKVRFPANAKLLQFCMSDTLSSAAFLTESAIYLGTAREETFRIAEVDYPFQADDVVKPRLLAAIDDYVLLERKGQLAVCSASLTTSLYRVPKPYWIAATAASRVFVVSPAEGGEADVIAFLMQNGRPFRVKTLVGFDSGGGCLPYAKKLATDRQLAATAAIVFSNFEGERCPKGDALFVWSGGTLLDIQRFTDGFSCVAVAIGEGVVVCVARDEAGANGAQTAKTLTAKISHTDGLVGLQEELLAAVSPADRIFIHPDAKSILCVSEDNARLRIWVLGDEPAGPGE